MFYLNTIELLFLFLEQLEPKTWLDQLEVCLPISRLLTGIPILPVFQNLRWNLNKPFLAKNFKIDYLMTLFIVTNLHFLIFNQLSILFCNLWSALSWKFESEWDFHVMVLWLVTIASQLQFPNQCEDFVEKLKIFNVDLANEYRPVDNSVVLSSKRYIFLTIYYHERQVYP